MDLSPEQLVVLSNLMDQDSIVLQRRVKIYLLDLKRYYSRLDMLKNCRDPKYLEGKIEDTANWIEHSEARIKLMEICIDAKKGP